MLTKYLSTERINDPQFLDKLSLTLSPHLGVIRPTDYIIDSLIYSFISTCLSDEMDFHFKQYFSGELLFLSDHLLKDFSLQRVMVHINMTTVFFQFPSKIVMIMDAIYSRFTVKLRENRNKLKFFIKSAQEAYEGYVIIFLI